MTQAPMRSALTSSGRSRKSTPKRSVEPEYSSCSVGSASGGAPSGTIETTPETPVTEAPRTRLSRSAAQPNASEASVVFISTSPRSSRGAVRVQPRAKKPTPRRPRWNESPSWAFPMPERPASISPSFPRSWFTTSRGSGTYQVRSQSQSQPRSRWRFRCATAAGFACAPSSPSATATKAPPRPVIRAGEITGPV